MKLRFQIEPRGLLLAVGLGIGGLACVLPAAVAANAEGPFLALNETAMNKMMAGMAVKPTRDADRDFVAMMVPHHQGAIDMAQAELQFGHNQKLLRIAHEIVVEQVQEIAALPGELQEARDCTSAEGSRSVQGNPPVQVANVSTFNDFSNAVNERFHASGYAYAAI